MISTTTPHVRRTVRSLWLFAICAGLCATTAAHAQRVRTEPEVVTKSSPRFRAAFRDVAAAAARGTVRVRCDDKETVLGAVVGANGWILTKASELKGEIVCQLH